MRYKKLGSVFWIFDFGNLCLYGNARHIVTPAKNRFLGGFVLHNILGIDFSYGHDFGGFLRDANTSNNRRLV